VVDTSNQRVLVWNTIPTSNGQAADFALGQANLTSGTFNSGGLSAASLGNPSSAFVAAGKLFVTDGSNNRVLGWNTLPTAMTQPADFVLGQANFTSNQVNSPSLSEQTLNTPRHAFSDGTRVFISDVGNYRVIVMPVPGI
jgi:hypothetical protein